MKRISITIRDSDYKKLKRIADKNGLSISATIRLLINKEVKE